MTTQADIDALTALTAKAFVDQGIVGQDIVAIQNAVAKLTPCPIVPPTPTPGNLTPSLGLALRTLRTNWMGDWLDLSKVPAPQPFVMWTDASKGILAPSQKGVVADLPAGPGWISVPVFSQRGVEYLYPPILVKPTDGATTRMETRAEDVVYQDDKNWANLPIRRRYGQRHEMLVSAYSTGVAHPTLDANGNAIPNAPALMLIGVDGAVDGLFLLDSAGKPNPYYANLGQIKLAPTEGSLDLAPNLAQRQIFFVVTHDRANGGRIIKVDRTAAIAAKPPGGLEDGALWVQTDLVTGLKGITSATCDDAGTTIFAAGNQANVIYSISVATGAVSVLMALESPYFIRRTSASDGERLIILDQWEGLHVVDRDGLNHQVIRSQRGLINFGALDVDRNGTCGEVNRIGFLSSHMDDGEGMRFRSGPNWQDENVGMTGIIGGQSQRTVGDGAFEASPIHYPWIFTFSLDQAVMFGQGFGNCNPFCLRPRQPSDPPRENWNHGLWAHGYNVAMFGPAGHEGTKPSFSCQTAPTLGLSFFDSDFICNMKMPSGEPDFAGMLAWFVNGGLGSFKRPELTGYGAYALLYWAHADSQALAVEGQSRLDKLAAFFGPAVVNNPTPMPSYPGASFPENGKHIMVHAVGTDLVAQAIDAYGVILTIDPACVMTCFVDELMPTQVSVGTMNAANKWTLPAPSVPKGQHVISCHVTSGQADHLGEAAYWTV